MLTTHDGHDDVSLFTGGLELVQIGKSTDNGLQAKLIREALCLRRVTNVESEVDLVQQLGRSQEAAEESATDVA